MPEYKILYAYSLLKLEAEVSSFIRSGWLLTGGVAVHKEDDVNTEFYQAIYKPKLI